MSYDNPWKTAPEQTAQSDTPVAPDSVVSVAGPADGLFLLTDVRRTFEQSGRKVHALDGMSLSINRGELVSVQGPTGGGKSTLLQMLGALDRPTSGAVVFDGVDLGSASDSTLASIRAKRIGFAFQSYNLIPTLTAQENVETALEPLGLSKAERRARASAALTSVGLDDRTTHLPAELSGGQQQRVAIARALVKDPDVLLADEPTGNLDESMRDEIIDLLIGIARERGITLVVVTHDTTVAQRMERHLVIAKGRLSV